MSSATSGHIYGECDVHDDDLDRPDRGLGFFMHYLSPWFHDRWIATVIALVLLGAVVAVATRARRP